MDDFATQPSILEVARYLRDIATEMESIDANRIRLVVAGTDIVVMCHKEIYTVYWGSERIPNYSTTQTRVNVWLLKAYICSDLNIEPLATKFKLRTEIPGELYSHSSNTT